MAGSTTPESRASTPPNDSGDDAMDTAQAGQSEASGSSPKRRNPSLSGDEVMNDEDDAGGLFGSDSEDNAEQ